MVTFVNGTFLVSNSEVSTFQDCPRKWWLAWHRGLVAKTHNVTSALATGSRIHEALASFYVPADQTPANPLDTLISLQSEVLAATSERVDAGDLYGDELEMLRSSLDEIEKVFDLERAMIEGYLQWLEDTGADSHFEVIAAEEYVEVDFNYIDDLKVKLIGKLDALLRNLTTGRETFMDHKTVAGFKVPGLRQNTQMLHYQLIKSLLAQGYDGGAALYNMLRKVKRTRASKPPYFERKQIMHNKHELAAHVARLINVIERIKYVSSALQLWPSKHHEIVPARPNGECHWKCPFFKICPMFDDGSRVEAAIEQHYEVKNPLHYYGGKETSVSI